MALLSALVKAIAEVEGIDEVQVGWVARHLREAGQISQAGRGRGAAHMSSADAASLLIGVNTATNAKNGAETVRLYRNLPCGKSNVLGKTKISSVFQIGKSFGEVFEQLIDLARIDNGAGSELERSVFRSSFYFRCVSDAEFDDFFQKHVDSLGEKISSEITFHRPYPNVSVLIADNVAKDVRGNSILDEEEPIAEVEFWDHKAKWPTGADRDERIRISLKTLITVGNVLGK
jgi:hypothetical protein